MTSENLKRPLPLQILKARKQAGLTQKEASQMIHLGRPSRWSEYETGVRQMPLASWELFLTKTNKSHVLD